MRELTYYVATSLDGRIAAPDGDFSAFSMVGDHIDMIVRDWTDTLPGPAQTALGVTPPRSRFDAVVMGWNTYAAGFPHGVDDPYPHLDQVVVTQSHLDHAVPAGVRLTADPVAEVQRLKAAPGVGVWLCGGGALAGAVVDEIDRLVVKVNPVLLGDGPALVTAPYAARDFRLDRTQAFGSGVVVNEYVRDRG